MLTELRVRDLVVIADVTLPLRPGLNVLTGETGAGKSMLVDALSLLLGERANTDLVRPGASRAVVEAAFDLVQTDDLARVADELGVELEEGRLVVRRTINAEGRNRAWANGSPTTVGALATLGSRLVDLHGQHESQSLLRPAIQRDILDAFGDALEERRTVAECHQDAQCQRAQEQELAERRDEVRKRADYLRHVAQEIDGVAPSAEEYDALGLEAKRLAHTEELTRLTERLIELLDGEADESAAAVLGQASRTLEQLTRIDDSVARWNEMLDAALANLDELTREVRDYESEIDLDPSRLAEVETRRDRIYRLLKKYGDTVKEVLVTGQEAKRELALLDTADVDLEALATRRGAAEDRLREAADALTAKREAAAGTLADAVEQLLPGLGMADGAFGVSLETRHEITAAGADSVTFTVQMNPGLDPRPLAQVASGGELSRLMLALKVVLAHHDRVQTLVFDEVDQGIGGEVGQQVADALGEVARARQVLVITHLPHIAARADHHLRVTKQVRAGIATADVQVLRGDERVTEIARMLGNVADPLLKKHAEELVAGKGTRTKEVVGRR